MENLGHEAGAGVEPELTLQFYLNQIDRSYAEIDRRSAEQFRCALTAIIALGAILGAVLQAGRSLWEIVVIIPWVHSVLGIIWTDHAFAINRCGAYIFFAETEIRKSGLRFRGNAAFVRAHRGAFVKRRRAPSLIITYFPLLYFLLPSLSAILAYFYSVWPLDGSESPDFWLYAALCAFGALFSFFLVVSWRRAVKSIDDISSIEVSSVYSE